MAAHSSTTGEEQKLSREVSALREALYDRTLATKRFADLDRLEDREERRKATGAAQAAFDAASSLEVEPLSADADNAYVTAEKAVALLKGDKAHVDAIPGPREERSRRESILSTSLDQLDRALAEVKADADRLRGATVDLDTVEGALRRDRSVGEAAEKMVNSIRETIAGLSADIRARSDDASRRTGARPAKPSPPP